MRLTTVIQRPVGDSAALQKYKNFYTLRSGFLKSITMHIIRKNDDAPTENFYCGKKILKKKTKKKEKEKKEFDALRKQRS